MFLVLLIAPGELAQGQEKPSPEPEESYGTPKAVFDVAFKAMKKRDFKTFARCLTAESQDRMTAQMVDMRETFKTLAAGGGDAKIKDMVADLDKALAKHGLTKEVLEKYKPSKDPKESEKATKALAAIVKDKPALMNDVMTVILKMSGEKGQPDSFELKDIKVTGDKARGTVVSKREGKDSSEPIDFIKVGGSWHIVLPDEKRGGKGVDPKGPPPPIEKE